METLYSLELFGLWPSSFGSPCPGKSWENCIFSLLLNPAASPLLFCQGISQSSGANFPAGNPVFETLTNPQTSRICALWENKDWWGISRSWHQEFLNLHADWYWSLLLKKEELGVWGGLYCKHSISQINSPSQHDTEHFCFPAEKLV